MTFEEANTFISKFISKPMEYDEDRDKLSVIYWMSHSDNLFSEGTKVPRNCDICVNRKECVLRYLGDWCLPQKYCRFYEKGLMLDENK